MPEVRSLSGRIDAEFSANADGAENKTVVGVAPVQRAARS